METRHQFVLSSPYRGNMFCVSNGAQSLQGPSAGMVRLGDALTKPPLFSFPELLEEDCYDELLPEKKRRLTPEQVHLLEKSFEAENKLEPERKTQLAKKLGLQPRQVAVWFQNRRARWKTKRLERDYDLLKASYDSLLSEYENVAKENEKLRAEGVSLTEKLRAKEVMDPKMDDEPEGADRKIDIGANARDRMSSSSGRSAVVDEESPQFIDGGNSYFPSNDYPDCMGDTRGIDELPSEEEGSESSTTYFSNYVFATTEQQHLAVDEPLGWWVWS